MSTDVAVPAAAPTGERAHDVSTPDGRTLATAELVLDIATAVYGNVDLDRVLASTLARLTQIVPCDGASAALRDGDELVVRAVAGPRAGRETGRRIPHEDRLAWSVIREGGAVRTPRTGGLERAWLGVAIARGAQTVGLLELETTSAARFSDADERLAITVGRALAGPVDRADHALAVRRAGKLRDAFIGVVSHELRTPITTIYGMSQVLRQHHESMQPADLRHVIEDIGAEADRLRRLAEDLLVLSRTEAGRLAVDFDPVLVGHIVRRRIADEASRWPDHRFSATIPPGLPLVLGEEMYVEQVTQNLLSNAAKYSPPGSEVRVEVDVPDGEVRVRVLDEGIGIGSEATPDLLFELFYRAPGAARRASGAGIGLFVCRELIEAMGGRVWASRRDGSGSEFGFALPTFREAELDVEGGA